MWNKSADYQASLIIICNIQPHIFWNRQWELIATCPVIRHLCQNIYPRIRPFPGWHGNLYLNQFQFQRSQFLFSGNFYRPYALLGEPDKEISDISTAARTSKKEHWMLIGAILLTLLTDMRLRNIMFPSGTPFFMSKDMAWTAEFPMIISEDQHPEKRPVQYILADIAEAENTLQKH